MAGVKKPKTNMKVEELIRMLDGYDKNKEVRIFTDDHKYLSPTGISCTYKDSDVVINAECACYVCQERSRVRD
jgi:hypothetical protein